MQPSSKSKIWTIPNLLSLVRIALIPAIVWSYLNLSLIHISEPTRH